MTRNPICWTQSMRPPLRWQLTAAWYGVFKMFTLGQHSLSLSFQPFEQRFEKMNKKIVFWILNIHKNMWIDIGVLKWWYSSNTASMYFYYCLHKSSTVRGSAVLSVLLLLACFVISGSLIIPLYSHYRDQAPMEPQLGDHWPMGAQWGQSHTAAWLMAGTQPWRGNAHMRRLLLDYCVSEFCVPWTIQKT